MLYDIYKLNVNIKYILYNMYDKLIQNIHLAV